MVYGVIMHAGNVRRIREKRVKREAQPSVLHVSRAAGEASQLFKEKQTDFRYL